MFRGNRNRDFKKGICSDDSRRKREDDRLQLRKKTRQEQLQKRRMGNDKAVVLNGANDAGRVGTGALGTAVRQDVVNELVKYRGYLCTGNPQEQYNSLMMIRKMISVEDSPPLQEVIDGGIVPILVQFLKRSENPGQQFEAAWALTNIASGTSEHTQAIIREGAIPIFVQLLEAPNPEVREQAVWALGNVAGDSAEFRNVVLEAGILDPLMNLFNTDQSLSLLRNTTWTLSNIYRNKPLPPLETVQRVLPIISRLLKHKDKAINMDACWALSYITDTPNSTSSTQLDEVLKSGILQQLVKILNHPEQSVQHPALRAIGNIVTGTERQTQVVVDSGVLTKLHELMNSPNAAIRKENCWTISNITAGSQGQIQSVINGGLVPVLIGCIMTSGFEVKKEATWAISNLASGGTDEQVKYLVSQNAIPALCSLFSSKAERMVLVALEAIENILRVGANEAELTHGRNIFADQVESCGGVDKMEELQQAESMLEEIYTKAGDIVRIYYEGGEIEGGFEDNFEFLQENNFNNLETGYVF